MVNRTLKNRIDKLTRFLHPSRKTLLLIIVVASITLILNTVAAVWLSKRKDLTVPTLGTVSVAGGDVE